MKELRNKNFIIKINEEKGYITSIINPQDEHKMNWVSELGTWGRIKTESDLDLSEYHRETGKCVPMCVTDICINDQKMAVTYKNFKTLVHVKRFFTESGNFCEQMTIKNISPSVLCINRDNFGVEFPLNDRYSNADDCMTNRCNAHIWCGINSSRINALRMGVSNINLGIMLTKGAFVSYSQTDCKTNVRGSFILEPESLLLKKDEEYTLEWELFWHESKADFRKKCAEYKTYIDISAKHFTVFDGENIDFRIKPYAGIPSVICDGENIPVVKHGDEYSVSYTPKRRGKHVFGIKVNDVRTYAEFMVKVPFTEHLRTRVNFIIDHQQCLDKASSLYGAYLVYDNSTESQYFDFLVTDHNACRERLNIPLMLIRYLQLCDDKKVRRSVDLFIDYLFREFYEEKTGEVFNNIGKTADALRLYNAPGVMLVFAEMYLLTKDERYINNIVMLAEKYYSIGGEKCYSNAVAIRKVMSALELSGREDDKKRMLNFFHLHVDNINKNGLSYPKHEVNYEQTIVTPAVVCNAEIGLYTDNKDFYAKQARMHLECLDRFQGNQPSYHLNEISIRYWDDFWFGKSKLFGDTLPHHLSCLSARAFAAYARLSGDKSYAERAEECIRNCLCLIDDDGHGHAAYVYPHTANGKNGELYDGWSNDQDLPFYDALNACDIIESFKI